MGGPSNTDCDRSGCPAQAQRLFVVYGQDFYFCNHHASELSAFIAALPTRPTPQPRSTVTPVAAAFPVAR